LKEVITIGGKERSNWKKKASKKRKLKYLP